MKIIEFKSRFYSLDGKINIKEGDLIFVKNSPIFLFKSIGKTVEEFKLITNFDGKVYRRIKD